MKAVMKRIMILQILLVLMNMSVLSVYADETDAIAQAYINNENINVFLRGTIDSQTVSVKVANRSTSNVKSGSLSDDTATIYTTLLVDTSRSMPKSAHQCVLELIREKIRGIAPNEKIRIVSFGSEIEVLQDFTHDRYDLANSVSDIEFKSSQSMIYDAIYQTIPTLDKNIDEPCFYHTIVITDGTDQTGHGITKDELYMRIHGEHYPVTSVRVSKEQAESVSKTLSALSRISGGSYIELYPGVDYSLLLSQIDVGGYIWVSADVDAVLLDGSTRQVDITDGIHSYSCDLKMSVVEKNETVVTAEPADKVRTEAADSDQKPVYVNNIFIIILAVVTGCSAVVAVAALIKSMGRKNKATDDTPSSYGEAIAETDETELYDDGGSDSEKYTIRLSNKNAPSEYWIIEIADAMVIGRDGDCTIRLEEKTVSHKQCKIIAREHGLMLINLSESNVTKLNNIPVRADVLISPGDMIKMGKVTLSVDYIKRIGREINTPSQMDELPGNETESIFSSVN